MGRVIRGRQAALGGALLAAAAVATAAPSAPEAGTASTWEISGSVRDASGRPVPLATIAVAGTTVSATADPAGLFRLRLPAGTFTLTAGAPGFVGEPRKVSVGEDVRKLDLLLVPLPTRSEAMVVSAIRADEKAPVPRTDLDRKEIETRSDGKEIGAFLQDTPSITQYSDTGLGNGYNYLALRGIGQTRVNMTFDGVPLNDPEDSAVYTVDYANLLGSTGSLQVQRGVGTSTFGAAAFAGSVSFASVDLADAFGGSARLGLGSFGTAMASAGVQSGLFGPDLKLTLRASWQETNGFRDSSGVLQKSLFYGLGRDVGSTTFKISGFVGQERTQEAFLAADAETLGQNLRANPLSPPEQDRFTLGLVQAQVTQVLGPKDSLSLQGFYEGTSGWYRLFADPERTTLWQYDLSWHFFGGTAAYRHEAGPFGLSVGVNAYGYESSHSRSVTGAAPDYENHGFKTQASGFVKVGWDAGR
jgi:iron complex outermembrane receptor protein